MILKDLINYYNDTGDSKLKYSTLIKNKEIYLELIKQLLENEPIGFIATLINSTILIYIQHDVIPFASLLIWYVVTIIITLFRFVGFMSYKKNNISFKNMITWRNHFICGFILSGLIWGSAGVFLIPDKGLTYQIFPVLILGGMVAGTAAAFSSIKIAFFSYSIPALLPSIIKFFSFGDSIHMSIAFMLLLFLLLMTTTAFRIHKINITSFGLRMENKGLVQFLSRSKKRTEKLNKELEKEIKQKRVVETELKKHQQYLKLMVKKRTIELKQTNKQLVQKIKEQKAAESALRASEKKYRLLVDNANDAIIIAQGKYIIFANPSAVALSGYSAEELSQTPFINIVHTDDRETVMDYYLRILNKKSLTDNLNFKIINKNKEERILDMNSVHITWQKKPAVLNFLRDVTARRSLEEKLNFIQKMESIGTLASGIAHDFNNLLMGIKGNLTLLMENKKSGHDDYEALKNINSITQSGAELTGHLLGVARGGKYIVKPVDFNMVLKKTAEIFGRTKKEIKISFNLEKKIWIIEIDQGQVEQVLLNLYINAWHAMKSKKRNRQLFLQTRNVILNKTEVKSMEIKPGKYVEVSVRDTGVGIDEKIKKRIFDPFFTTKKSGRGSGLGLASAYGIIKNHNGFITVESELNKGSAFIFYLPITNKKIKKEKIIKKTVPKRTGTVLLIDDEIFIINVCKRLLEKNGFRVLSAPDGKEGIRIYQEEKKNIDLVMLDLVMPGMSSNEIYDELKKINPNVKVLLASGYSVDGLPNQLMQKGCNGFIQKPFEISNLLKKIREILEK